LKHWNYVRNSFLNNSIFYVVEKLTNWRSTHYIPYIRFLANEQLLKSSLWHKNGNNVTLVWTFWCLFYILKADVEELIVNAPRITDHYIRNQLFESNLTLCVVGVFTLQTDKCCVHNRLFNGNFEEISKWTPDT
jgi:hypothetical protein